MEYTCKVNAEGIYVILAWEYGEKKWSHLCPIATLYDFFSVEEKLLPSLPSFKGGFVLLLYNNTKPRDIK